MSNIEDIARNVLEEFGLEGTAIYVPPDTIKIRLVKKYYEDQYLTKDFFNKREDVVNSLKIINKIRYRVTLDLDIDSNE